MRSETRRKNSVSWTIDIPVIKVIKDEAKRRGRPDSFVANEYLRKFLKKVFKTKGMEDINESI